MTLHPETLIIVAVYVFTLFTVARVLLDNGNTPKAMSYAILAIMLPVVGSVAYFVLGVNYRKKRIYSKKLKATGKFLQTIREKFVTATERLIQRDAPQLGGHTELAELLLREAGEPLSLNRVTLLNNGEEKFPAVLEDLEKAQHFIHIEYYIYEDDGIGNRIKEVLIRKAKEGVKVRFIYDDFGSRSLREDFLGALKKGGVDAVPFYRVFWPFLASRMNYRNHRKIIVIDGHTGYVGGINISDRYLNTVKTNRFYWRDIHARIEGPAVWTLQYTFLADWNFCSRRRINPDEQLFPHTQKAQAELTELVQIVAGGPDYPRSAIMLSYFTAIANANERIYLTSPYFIPNASIFDALRKAALSGKDVRLLVPGISDAGFANAASRAFYQELLECGVKIYLYQKGFVHSKTLIVDDYLSFVGTANMDNRSFDLNFEINAVIYGKEFCGRLADSFLADLNDSKLIALQTWRRRSRWQVLGDKIARLFSPLL
ncbi:MAG: Major cardiolipin synthase ClsA [Saprospiraceae bacterium]|nr:Major cardiolipin synthase ClsA [Saprospiraceae bacterium]